MLIGNRGKLASMAAGVVGRSSVVRMVGAAAAAAVEPVAKSGLAALFATDGVKKSLSFFRRV